MLSDICSSSHHPPIPPTVLLDPSEPLQPPPSSSLSMATVVMTMGEQYTGVKRSFHQMLDHVDTNLSFDDMSVPYHAMSRAGYYTTPPPTGHHQHTLFSSNPYETSSPNVGYVEDGYLPPDHTMYTFTGTPNRSISESFPHTANESFGSASSAASSCNEPSTPPPRVFGPLMAKYPAVPITPSHAQPRQKAKRTATVSSLMDKAPPFFFSFVFFSFANTPSQACEECRKRKQKCDGKAACQSCKEQKLPCKYREVQPTKYVVFPSPPPPYLVTLSQQDTNQYDQQPNRKDNSMERLASLVESFGKSMEELNHRLDVMNSTLHRMEKRLTRCWHCAGTVDLETGDCLDCNQASSCRMMNPM